MTTIAASVSPGSVEPEISTWKGQKREPQWYPHPGDIGIVPKLIIAIPKSPQAAQSQGITLLTKTACCKPKGYDHSDTSTPHTKRQSIARSRSRHQTPSGAPCLPERLSFAANFLPPRKELPQASLEWVASHQKKRSKILSHNGIKILSFKSHGVPTQPSYNHIR